MSAHGAMVTLILGPLLAAALCFAFPRQGRWLALAVALLAGAALTHLTGEVLARGVLIHRVGGWGAPLGIDLRADGLTVLMLIITTLIVAAVVVYASRYFAPHPGASAAPRDKDTSPGRHFWPLLLFLWSALHALFLSGDIFNLYVTLELLGFSAVALVALAGGPSALTAALRYLLVSLAASLFYLLGVALVYGQYATVDLATLAANATANPATWMGMLLMTGGLVAKAALFPLHFWLPPAHANAPAPVSALLSALVVKGAFFILLRLWFEAFHALLTPAVATVFGALGAGAVFWGSIHALFQPRLKLLIAYSTVAQLGYLFLVFPLGLSASSGFSAWSGALIFLAGHACAKTAMFLAAGSILHAAGHDRIRDLDGITHALPVSSFAFGLAGLSLVGLPPSCGFAGKWLLLSAAFDQGQWWWIAVMLAGSLLAAAYVMRVLAHAFTNVPEPAAWNPIPRQMEWVALLMALLAVGLGLLAHWPAELLRAGAPLGMGGLSS